MALLSIGAVLIGVVVIAVALLSTGQVGPQSSALKDPVDGVPPQSLWDGRALGSKSAPVTLEAFEDFQCPACDMFSTQTEPQLIKDYITAGKLRLVYKDMAFIGQESLDAAVAARCAGDQGLFWPYHDYVFANQKGENKGYFSADFLRSIATKVGADVNAFNSCVGTQGPKDAVTAETKEGSGKGVVSTPTLFLNGQKIVGVPAYQDLKSAIDGILAGASGSPVPSGPATSESPSPS